MVRNDIFKRQAVMTFKNAYEDNTRAESYAKLEYPGTYYLAFRDIPGLLSKYTNGQAALDFGCGTGRSTRYLKAQGFDSVGIDISKEMLAIARRLDTNGEYILTPDGDLSVLSDKRFDLIFSSFTFDNIPSFENKISLFTQFKSRLNANGIVLNMVSTPDMYLHEWHSFSTKNYPENHKAKAGDIVRIITTAVEDKRPVEDILMTDQAYREVYERAGLSVIEMHKPLGKKDEPYDWVNEDKIAPWAIYILGE